MHTPDFSFHFLLIYHWNSICCDRVGVGWKGFVSSHPRFICFIVRQSKLKLISKCYARNFSTLFLWRMNMKISLFRSYFEKNEHVSSENMNNFHSILSSISCIRCERKGKSFVTCKIMTFGWEFLLLVRHDFTMTLSTMQYYDAFVFWHGWNAFYYIQSAPLLQSVDVYVVWLFRVFFTIYFCTQRSIKYVLHA